MKKQHGFSSIIILIILAVLAGGGYWFWQSQPAAPSTPNSPPPPPVPTLGVDTTGVDTADWKTYTTKIQSVPVVTVEFKYPDDWQAKNFYYIGSRFPDRFDSNELPAGVDLISPDGDVINIFGSRASMDTADCKNRPGQTRCVEFSQISTGWTRTGSLKSEVQEIFDEVVSTIKFLGDVSDWKTYRNEEYGFEVKYPPVWSICANEDKDFLCIKDSIKNLTGVVTELRFSHNPELFNKYNNYSALKTYLNYRRPDILADFGPADLAEGKTISEEPFIRAQECDDGCRGIYYFFSKNNLFTVVYILPITYDGESTQGTKRVDDLKNIISTFRFTK